MRAKTIALLMVALGCGLIAMIGYTQVLAKRNVEPAPVGETQSIYIAAKDIPLGERLSSEYLKLEAWPKDKVPPGAVLKLEDIDSCRTRTKLYAGEPILEKKLFSKGTSMQGDSALIPKGLRVVPVKVDNVSGGPGLIVPGDRVDVLVHLEKCPSRDIQGTSTRTILQDIKVFAVNDVVDIERDKDSKSEKDKMSAKTISLLVTPSQAAKLMLASEMGKLRLIMRSYDDKENSVDGNASPDELFGATKDKSKREQETLLDPEPAKPVVKTGLMDLLNSMKKNLAKNAKTAGPAIASNETWTMTILAPNGRSDIVLQADSSPQAAKSPNGSWHIISTTQSGPGSVSGATGQSNTTTTTPTTTPPTPTTAAPPATQPGEPSSGAPTAEPAAEQNTSPPSANGNPLDQPSSGETTAAPAGDSGGTE